MNDYPTEMPSMPTESLKSSHKEALDKISSDMTGEQLEHAANHLRNKADKLHDHSKKSVTMKDFHKAMKRGDMVKDTDGDNV